METRDFLVQYQRCLQRQLAHQPRLAAWAFEQLRELLEGPAGKGGRRPPLPQATHTPPQQ